MNMKIVRSEEEWGTGKEGWRIVARKGRAG
jgi:hypothetical protein